MHQMQVQHGLLDMLPRAPAVAAFMVDFEAALWQALHSEFPVHCVCVAAVLRVLRGLLGMLPRAPAVAAFMVDFEAALWQTLHKDCIFHFAQATCIYSLLVQVPCSLQGEDSPNSIVSE